jgi:hypothetical protein
MRLLRLAIVLAVATAGFADTITLRSGRVIDGTYLGGTSRQVRVDVGDQIQTLDITDVARIEFGRPAPAPPPVRSSSDEDRPVLRRSDSAMQPAPASAATGTMELPAGTNLVVRMIDGVDSDTNSVGQTFAASIDEPVMVDGRPVIPRGADVAIKLVDSKESGKLTGRAELTLNLVSVKVNGRPVDINTQSVSRESGSRGQQTAKVVGGTAVVGTILGAIAGGGKGAAIGAVAGGAAGAGAEMVLKGQRVKVPSETRLTFVLDTPVKI